MGDRPPIITSLKFAQALAAAGVIDADVSRVSRLTVIAEPASPVMIHVEYFGDARLLDLAGHAAEAPGG